MKVALIGLEQVGKTTLFGALTRQPVKVGFGGFGDESRIAVVEVPDTRIDALAELYRPRKITYATVEVVDGGGTGSAAGGTRFGSDFLAQIRQSDALIVVLRVFESPSAPLPDGGLDPQRDYRNLEAELILADLDLVEKRLERMEKQDRSKPKSAQGSVEKETILRIREHLEQELPLTSLSLSSQEQESVQHLEFVSAKPRVIVANIGEGDLPDGAAKLDDLRVWAERSGTPVLPMAAAVELEVSQLPPDEEAAFLADFGIDESGRSRLLRTVYELLGLQSFLTSGEDEVRAWTIRRGDTALVSAGKIHSDLARGFIRAEVIPFAALIEAGDEKAARAKGLYRLEPKGYEVRDGDILNIRFSV